MKALPLVLAAAMLVCSQARGAIVVSGDVAAGTGQFEITENITFNVLSTGILYGIVFDEWVSATDGHNTTPPVTPSSFSYTLNGGPVLTSTFYNVSDNYNTTLGGMTPNDGYTNFDGLAVNAGDVLVIQAGVWSLAANPQFNPDAVGTFTGDVFGFTGGIAVITDVVTVPEPSSALLAFMAAGLFLRRRR